MWSLLNKLGDGNYHNVFIQQEPQSALFVPGTVLVCNRFAQRAKTQSLPGCPTKKVKHVHKTQEVHLDCFLRAVHRELGRAQRKRSGFPNTMSGFKTHPPTHLCNLLSPHLFSQRKLRLRNMKYPCRITQPVSKFDSKSPATTFMASRFLTISKS
jgi:hypothetical protein